MSITEFISARVAELKQRAEDWRTLDRRHFDAVIDACLAMQRIVELHQDEDDVCIDGDYLGLISDLPPCDTIRALAAIWSDHEDYDEEWR